MTVSNTTPVPETTPIYIGTDGGGPGTSFSTANFNFFFKFSCTVQPVHIARLEMPVKMRRWSPMGNLMRTK